MSDSKSLIIGSIEDEKNFSFFFETILRRLVWNGSEVCFDNNKELQDCKY